VPFSDLLLSIRNLDARLLRVVQVTSIQTNQEPNGDPFRGLYIGEADVYRDLSVGESGADWSPHEPMAVGEPFERLREIFGLSSIELDILLIALAPEISPRYERIYAYLQDDVRRRQPTVDLMLTLLYDSAEERLIGRNLFRATYSLQRHGLIHLKGDDLLPLPSHEVFVTRRISAFLLGETGLSEMLARFAYLIAKPVAEEPARVGLLRVAQSDSPLGVRAYFHGQDAAAMRSAATAMAAELGVPILIAAMGRTAQAMSSESGSAASWLGELLREAVLRQATVYLEDFDAIPTDAARDEALTVLGEFRGIALLSGAQELRTDRVPLEGVLTVDFPLPDWTERRETWELDLRAQGVEPPDAGLDALAECFRFSVSQIDEAAATASLLALYCGEPLSIEHAFEAARIRSGQKLASLARKVVPVHGWADLVLPPEVAAQLREMCCRVTHRHQVMGTWGFERKLSGCRGMNALFHGLSGTGKTMAAEVIAHELGLDLYKIDLAGVVSKYIGETEKNLDRIFTAAADANAILFFDEADALFGKRSEVRDAHDRYANLEVSYLLQKMEEYEGISILSTNLRQNLDEAFLRRLTFAISFPFPDEWCRQRIWESTWPAATPVAPDVDAGWLAASFLLSGGNIRNVAVAAAFLAAEDKVAVGLEHVLRAVRSEFQKMGKTLSAAELAPPSAAPEEVAA
jgi:AAA+ superfamily predicted ATPase